MGPRILGGNSEVLRKQRSPYNVKDTITRAQTTGSKPRDTSSITMPNEESPKEEKTLREKDAAPADKTEKKKRKSKRQKGAKDADSNKIPKTILRNKDTPRSKSRVVIKEEENIEYEKGENRKGVSASNRDTSAVTINTPLRGNPDSPLKPYK